MKNVIYQGIPIVEAKQLLNEAGRRIPIFPPIKDRKTFTVAETRAAMHSIIKSGYYEDGIYAIIDIGAGTTDISFFRNGMNDIDEKLFSFYFDQSHILGGDDFDSNIYDAIYKKYNLQNIDHNLMFPAIQNAKHGMIINNGFNLVDFNIILSLENIYNICIGNYLRLSKCFSESLIRAFKKEQKWDRWNEINILLIGGGSKLHRIDDSIKSIDIQQLKIWNPKLQKLHMADNIDTKYSNLNEFEFAQNYHYFYTAHGLSYYWEDITEAKLPDDINDFRPPRQIRQFVDKDDLYVGMKNTTIEK